MAEPVTAVSIGKAIAGPLIGGALKAALERGSKKKFENIERFQGLLNERLNRVEQKCEDETLTRLYNAAAMSLATSAHKEKVGLFAQILEGVYDGSLEDLYADMFMDISARLLPPHLLVLAHIKANEGLDKGVDGGNVPGHHFDGLVAHLSASLARPLEDIRNVTVAVLNELIACGLLASRMETGKSRTPMVGMNPVGLLSMQVYYLTRLGRRYVFFLREQQKEGMV